MTHILRAKWLIAPLTVLALALAGCSATDDTTTTTVAAADVTTTVAQLVDVSALANDFLVSMPEGYFGAGDAAAVKEAVDVGGAYLIDVRQPSEYEEGHIPGAVNIPIRELTKNLDLIPMDQAVIVYCASGYRAAMSMASLQMLGYDNVKAFGASYKGWVAAEQEISTDGFAGTQFVAPDIEPDLLAAVEDFLLLMPEGYLSVGDAEKMQAAMDANAYVLDVRETSEFAEGRIPGATNVPLRTLISNLDSIPTDTQVVVYCKSGYRAAIANAILHIAGLDNAVAFPASYAGWTDAGLDVEA